MSDETFFREVNEEIRHQRVHDLWKRFGRWLLAAAVLAVLAAAAYVAWREYQRDAADAAGDRFISAVDLADGNKLGDAANQLEAIQKDGFGSYPQLALLRLATIRERQGDAKNALAGFNAVAKDATAPKTLRDMAAVRAAYVLVDAGTLDEVRAQVERLSDDKQPLRFAAREALGLAAWKAGNIDEARRFLTQNRDDAATPSGIALRARVILDLADAGTTPASAAADASAAPAPAPTAELLPTPIPLDIAPPAAAETPSPTPPAAPGAPVPPPAAPSN